MKHGKALLAVIGACVLAYFAATLRTPRSHEDLAPAQAEDFTLPDLKGKPIALSSFKGQVVLLDFWATWCGPCLDELPDLKKLYAKHHASGFTIVGVSADEETKDVPPFADQNGILYPILLSGGDLPPGYEVRGIPAAFLIDRRGRIIKHYLGEVSYGELSSDVQRALAEPNLVK